MEVGCHPSPGDLPDPGMEPRSPAFQVDSLPTEPLGKFLNWVSKNFGINLEKEYTDVSKAFYAPQIWSLLDNSGHSAASPGGSALKGNCQLHVPWEQLWVSPNLLPIMESQLQIPTCLTLSYKSGAINLQTSFKR